MSRQKKSKAFPIVLVLTVILALICTACFYADPLIAKMKSDALAAKQKEVDEYNALQDQAYAAAIARFEQENTSGANQAWPTQKSEGWDVVDLTNYPLESPTYVPMSRADALYNGLLLVNQWHSRPADFEETALVSVGKYSDKTIQVKDYNVLLFPVAVDALRSALADAKELNLTHFMVNEGYRSWETQNEYFQNKVTKLSSKYSGDTLIEAAKKEVNYPGTSEFNSGLAFTLRLYDKNDKTVGEPKYSTTEQAQWLNENCWKYGLVFRFPLAGWPLESSTDKHFITGISSELNLYRYVGKGHAAVMHALDLCLEEYVQYLAEHPHIAVFENGQLKYEVIRQYVGEAETFDALVTLKTPDYVCSLDNMGGLVTIFEY